MKTLPDIKSDPSLIFDLQYGAVKAWMLKLAVEMKIFNIMSKWMSAAEAAAALSTHPRNTELFLNALCSLELLKKRDGKYRNSEPSDAFLKEGTETCITDFMRLNDQFIFQSQDKMRDALRDGPLSKPESGELDGDFFAASIRTMKNFARAGQSQKVAAALSALPEFKRCKKMLDLGGAHGLDSVATALLNPELHGVVFDFPPAIEATREIIAEYEIGDRVGVKGGDFTSDDIGGGYDLILAKGTLNFAGPALGAVIEKIYAALNPGGVFVSIHDGLTEEGTQPKDLIISWLAQGMSSADVTLAKDVIPEAMRKAGFTGIECSPYDFPVGGVLDMNVGRKPM